MLCSFGWCCKRRCYKRQASSEGGASEGFGSLCELQHREDTNEVGRTRRKDGNTGDKRTRHSSRRGKIVVASLREE
jgi:hypothetical protein